jgi:hypothetical protein
MTLHLLQGMKLHVMLQALGVFVVTTAVWMPWLLPYLRDALRRLRGRSAP